VSGPGGWQEVGDRVYRRRYASLDLNVGAVVGADEVLVVDTRSFAAEAARLLADLRALTRLPCRQVVNTHAHFDLVLDPPERTVGDAGADLEVGGRRVELRFCGRGHTDHDLVVIVPDAGVVFAGDLVEEGGPPVYGTDAFPLEWPAALGRLLALAPPTVVPGHGDVVGHRFVAGQREELAAMAALCRRVAAGELPAGAAARAAPFPESVARDALALSARAAWPAGGAAPGTARPG
jgi:glyoxylase-like metal-dependent hydrolase (beta-lactamase superfamily II)